MSMLRSLVVVVLSSLWLGGCGGPDIVTPDPPPAPTPAKASLAVSYMSGSAKLGRSKDARYTYALQFQVQIVESAGLSVNADYVRLQMFRNGVELERSEINAADIIAGAGTNLIPGGATKTWTLTLRFNDDRWTTYNLFFHFTDAKGNQFTATVPGFPDLTTTAQALSRDRGQSLPTL